MFIFGVGFALSFQDDGQCESLRAWNGNSRTPRFFLYALTINYNPHSWGFLCNKNLSFMSNKNKNEELQSRREFFKKAAKAALPVVGAVVLSSVPFLKAEATTGCTNSCLSSCQGCKGTCTSNCKIYCSGCGTSCFKGCASGCSWGSGR